MFSFVQSSFIVFTTTPQNRKLFSTPPLHGTGSLNSADSRSGGRRAPSSRMGLRRRKPRKVSWDLPKPVRKEREKDDDVPQNLKATKRRVRVKKKKFSYKIRRLPLKAPGTTKYKYKLKNGELRIKKCFDGRSFRMMRSIFDKKKGCEEKPDLPTEKLLREEKRRVMTEIKRQRKLSKTSRGSPLERAFYTATGEKALLFDYDLMLRMIKSAKLIALTRANCDGESGALGYMDPNRFEMRINKTMKMTPHDLRVTIMHEALHGTVRRQGRSGTSALSTDLEHLSMAMLGDRDEFNDFWNCVKSLRLAKKRSRARTVISGFIERRSRSLSLSMPRS